MAIAAPVAWSRRVDTVSVPSSTSSGTMKRPGTTRTFSPGEKVRVPEEAR
jgi:hypothetical protein